MDETKSEDRIFGNLALRLLVAGLLLPFLIAMFADQNVAMGFGVVAVLLALLFGIIGRKQKTGRVTVIVVSCLGLLAIIMGTVSISKRSEARTKMEAARVEAMRRHAEQSTAPLPSAPWTGPSEGAR